MDICQIVKGKAEGQTLFAKNWDAKALSLLHEILVCRNSIPRYDTLAEVVVWWLIANLHTEAELMSSSPRNVGWPLMIFITKSLSLSKGHQMNGILLLSYYYNPLMSLSNGILLKNWWQCRLTMLSLSLKKAKSE